VGTDLPIPCCGRPWSAGRRWSAPWSILICSSVNKKMKVTISLSWRIVGAFPQKRDIVTLEQSIWSPLRPSGRCERCF
jgi:hypothetical protein